MVSWNFGIHDIARNQEHMTLPVYEQMLGVVTDALLACRKQNGTKLLYVLTTPVPTVDGNASTYDDFGITFWDHFSRIFGSNPPHAVRMSWSPCCPCGVGADWCLQADAVTNLGLQAPLGGLQCRRRAVQRGGRGHHGGGWHPDTGHVRLRQPALRPQLRDV